jgi:HK97 family phage prohead protease
MKRLGFAVAFKTVDNDGSISGYASTFGNVDQGGDIVAPGAFKAWIAANGRETLPMLFGHDANRIAGVWRWFHEDAKGLHVRGQVIRAASTGHEVYALAKAGAIKGLSIGYKTRQASRNATTGIRTLLAVDLKEVSVTAFPMNEEARITRVKHANGELAGLLAMVRGVRAEISCIR